MYSYSVKSWRERVYIWVLKNKHTFDRTTTEFNFIVDLYLYLNLFNHLYSSYNVSLFVVTVVLNDFSICSFSRRRLRERSTNYCLSYMHTHFMCLLSLCVVWYGDMFRTLLRTTSMCCLMVPRNYTKIRSILTKEMLLKSLFLFYFDGLLLLLLNRIYYLHLWSFLL